MHYREYKSVLSSKNGINVYRGCTHGCIYCDSRSKCYNMEHEFEDIEIKTNAPAMLADALRRKRAPCMIGTGSMCDPYMPVEREIQYTRKCLEAIDGYGFGATIITKSDLILRDTDLLVSINKNSKCVVQVTITTADDRLCRMIEPNVCPTSARYSLLKELHELKIPTVVWLCPILPFINDTEDNIRRILDMCFDAGVRGILCFGMGVTLREGNREYFYGCLDKSFPDIKAKYINSFGNAYECKSPHNTRLMRIFHNECDSHGVMHNTNEIFSYLNEYESGHAQMTIF